MKYLALVTGASSGIGLVMARELAARNIDLILVARSEDKLEELGTVLSEKHGIDVRIFARDLSSAKAACELHASIKEEGLTVTHLVNNAGFGVYGLFDETDLDQELNMIDLNISALVTLTKLFLQDMKARNNGHILNMASLLSLLSFPRYAVYSGTKAFVLNFSEALRGELKGSKVKVTAFCPGPVDSNFTTEGMAQSNAYQMLSLDDPKVIGRKAVNALLKGKGTVLPGFPVKMIVFSTRFGSRNFNLRINRFMSSPSKKALA